MDIDDRTPEDVIEELKRRGHKIGSVRGFDTKVMGIRFDSENGVILGGARSTGNIAWTMGW